MGSLLQSRLLTNPDRKIHSFPAKNLHNLCMDCSPPVHDSITNQSWISHEPLIEYADFPFRFPDPFSHYFFRSILGSSDPFHLAVHSGMQKRTRQFCLVPVFNSVLFNAFFIQHFQLLELVCPKADPLFCGDQTFLDHWSGGYLYEVHVEHALVLSSLLVLAAELWRKL